MDRQTIHAIFAPHHITPRQTDGGSILDSARGRRADYFLADFFFAAFFFVFAGLATAAAFFLAAFFGAAFLVEEAFFFFPPNVLSQPSAYA